MQHNPQHLHALSSQPCLSREFNMTLSLNLRERRWLGPGLGAGLMYLLDWKKGDGRRERGRGYVVDAGRQAGALLDETRRTLGQQAQAVLATTRRPFQRQLGLGERLRTQAAQPGMTTGVALVGGVGLGAGLRAPLGPQGGPPRRGPAALDPPAPPAPHTPPP